MNTPWGLNVCSKMDSLFRVRMVCGTRLIPFFLLAVVLFRILALGVNIKF
jgi:hypothetical protein